MHSNEWEQPARDCVQIIADRYGIAAGRDVNIAAALTLNPRLLFDALQAPLAHRADDPRAVHCTHCGLRGMPPDANECLFCHHDVGQPRRAREAAQQAQLRRMRLIADVRSFVCYSAALALITALMAWRFSADDGLIGVLFAGVVMTLFTGEVFVLWSIHLEVWVRYNLAPRLRRGLERRGLGWLLG